MLVAGALAITTAVAVAAPAQAAPAPAPAPTGLSNAAGSLTSEVEGSFTDAAGALGSVSGDFSPTKFAKSGNGITATGILTATLTDSTGTALGTVQRTVSMPVELPTGVATRASCPVLNLILGPLHLDLLGLVVDLNRVILNIVAESGAGNLLGNLVCAIANLLNGGLNLPLAMIVDLLNQILAILRM
ncbi:hypothetical protein GCM10012284_09080 [Mangrovihabitans endophyticus]|uniref:ABC transporter substrate-binding protein n=2 Tax=Mangrovihabitans endophyticus TaxID=1751298 RepID=A0A8J3FMM9_9ACTN|nr:hypothetical protein GCM10012284_09080 [Mangrovihabitans endophyticus]